MSGPIVLGPVPVTVDMDALTRFAAATRSAADAVPLTFPIRWLALPPVRAAILALARPGEIAVHEEQVFDYVAPLTAGASYQLRAELERTYDPDRIALGARVEANGAPVLTMRTVLRLFAAGDGAVQAPAQQVAQQ